MEKITLGRDFDFSLSISNPHPHGLSNLQKIALAMMAAGGVIFMAGAFNLLQGLPITGWLGVSSIVIFSMGSVLYIYDTWWKGPAGIRNDRTFFNPLTNRGAGGWMLGIALTTFYILLYWGYDYQKQEGPLDGMVSMVDPISWWLRGKPADHWFLYSFVYTLAVSVMGLRTIGKYRHNRYQIVRTLSVMFFQIVFAFTLPYFFEAMSSRNTAYFISYFWPLDYDVLWPESVSSLLKDGALGKFVLYWSILLSFVAVPVLTYFFGKRWYCSWVCGCGGLAETAGDPFRHLSAKTRRAWRIERIIIYSILGVITLLTLLLWVAQWVTLPENFLLTMKKSYGFLIGSIFSGVVGTGFYPIFGNRSWCRFGCPLAAILGILQKHFSRFRITTNGNQCISCGNCSVYCEMGIDVRWYAQQRKNIIRASCVGCGICAAVCPRGVLRLENGPAGNRYDTISPHEKAG